MRVVHAASPVVHAQCMPCVKTALVWALGSTSAAHMSVPSCPTRRCPPRAPQLRQHACYYQLAYVYMLCMCLRCHSSSLFIHRWHAARVAPRRRRRDIWCEPAALCPHRALSTTQKHTPCYTMSVLAKVPSVLDIDTGIDTMRCHVQLT